MLIKGPKRVMMELKKRDLESLQLLMSKVKKKMMGNSGLINYLETKGIHTKNRVILTSVLTQLALIDTILTTELFQLHMEAQSTNDGKLTDTKKKLANTTIRESQQPMRNTWNLRNPLQRLRRNS